MRNGNILKLNFIAILAFIMAFISCNNYEDDISNLRVEITELRQKIDDINSAIKDGVSIKSVESTTNGIIITLSNNDSYTITNGNDGASGADGSVVTIGDNGNWFIDGEDTELPSKGEDGVLGGYFYPHEDGFWYKVENDVEEKTDQTWLPTGTITAILENGTVKLYNVEGADGPITLGQATLTNLTFIPDYVTKNDVGVVNFSFFTTQCGEIAPSTKVRYQVNPSNATIDMIDKDNLYFKYNNPTVLTKSSEIDPKASFISLEKGILTVEVQINIDALEEEGSNKIDQIMLVAPLKSGGEVNSDWAKVVSSQMSYENLALAFSPIDGGVENWSSMELTKTLDETKSISKLDPRILNMKYNETIDLKKIVKTMFTEGDWSDFNIDTYNLEIAFDLKDEEGNAIVNKSDADVDQQQFIKLEGSIATALVYEIEGLTPPTVDRNPILHVTLKPKEGDIDCKVLEGFIKINLTESDLDDIPPVLFSASEVQASCGEFIFRISSEEMNEAFYSKSQISKEIFHNNYNWVASSEGVGSITQEADPNDTESFNLVWRITEDEIWNQVGETITKTGSYTFESSVIEVTFTASIVQPIAELSGLLLKDLWFNNNSYIKHEVSTPEINLNSVFQSTNEKLLDLKAAGEEYADYSYEYIFDKEQPLTVVDGITISVSSDQKELLANSEVIAKIAPQAAGEGDILSFNQESELAMTLLNKEPEFLKASIKLLLNNECGRLVTVNAFDKGNTFLIHFFINLDSGTVFVVPGGTGSGKAWDDAMGDIQAAVNRATEGNAVWVKGGNYVIKSPIITKNTIDMYGGFTGNETSIEERQLASGGKPWDFSNPTILDAQKQSQIMQSPSIIDSKTIVDGFTFINGNGVGSINGTLGGAIYIDSEFAIYQKCIVRDNSTEERGGGVTMTKGTLHQCLIENNNANVGGGLYLNATDGTTTKVKECSIKNNEVSKSGGGLNVGGSGKVFVLQSKIYSNSGSAGAFSNNNVNFEIANSLIYNNGTVDGTEAYVTSAGGNTYNCTFVNNIKQIYHTGGGTSTNAFKYVNNIIWGNTEHMSGGFGNRNITLYNNATQLDQSFMEQHWGENENNIKLLADSDLEFIRASTFQGRAENETQMQELDNVDFNLKTTSPCVDTGKTNPEVTHDIVGTSRPQGAAYDIGAYEAIK